MYEIPTGNSNAQQEAEKHGAKSTLGVGRTAPQGWIDGGSVHKTLKGVQMVSNHLHPSRTRPRSGLAGSMKADISHPA